MAHRQPAVAGWVLVLVLCIASPRRGFGAYTAAHSCEAGLAAITSPQGSTTTTSQTTGSVGSTGTVSTETTTVVTRYNTTVIDRLLTYFGADLAAADNTAGHTQSTASLHCGATGDSMTITQFSLGKLKSQVMETIATCGYKVGTNGTHLYSILFRIETECARNADDKFCLLPADFLKATTGPWSHTVTKTERNPPFTVTTAVVTTYTYDFTYGDSDLVKGICPDANKTDTDRAAPSLDCCNRVLYDAQLEYLGFGPKLFCEQPKGIDKTCLSVAPASVEITDAVGGTLEMSSGTSVTFPPGALANSGCPDPCQIFAQSAPATDQAAAITQIGNDKPEWKEVEQAASFADFEPSLKFAVPVTVCLKTVVGAASDVSEAYQFDATTNKIIGEAKPETSFNKEKGLLCFKTSSFSRYGGISRKISSGAVPQKGAAVDTVVPTAAIVGGVMGGLLLLTGCTFIFWYTERNRQKEMVAHARESRQSSSANSPMGSPVPMQFVPMPMVSGMSASPRMSPNGMMVNPFAANPMMQPQSLVGMNGMPVGGSAYDPLYGSSMPAMPMSSSSGPMY